MIVRALLSSELDWANERYSEIDFVRSDPSNFVAIAESDGIKAGLGRVVPITSKIGELGGMYVLPDFRGQSIAAQLVQYLIANSGFSTLFCIPFAHLASFYAQHGFIPVSESTMVPAELESKFRWCQQHYPNPVRLMYQHIDSQPPHLDGAAGRG